MPERRGITRLAIVVSHPIQYLVPLYQLLARRDDLRIKVFYTWHAGTEPVEDRGFGERIAWDIPLTEGYEYELVANQARDPGMHHFFGLRNPGLVEHVMAWGPDVVMLSGWAWYSHMMALRAFHRLGVPTLFRGDSHLLDAETSSPRFKAKRALLDRVFRWPAGFLTVGSANTAYYERFGVEQFRLHPCPPSVDVDRFAEPADALEQEAASWRETLGVAPDRAALLFAGKFEPKKRPVELMRCVQQMADCDPVLVMVGGGPLQSEIDSVAASNPERFRIVPFQNQSRMPVVYRLGDLFVLPSSHGETWGLAVNEAMACGRPAIVSDRVGCAADLIDASCGRVFPWNDWDCFATTVSEMLRKPSQLAAMGRAAAQRARLFDIAVTETALIGAIDRLQAA